MYTTVSGYYKDGELILNEQPQKSKDSKVLVTFLEEKIDENTSKGIKLGSLSNKGFSIPDDFNEPVHI
jgi:hypothetical protein